MPYPFPPYLVDDVAASSSNVRTSPLLTPPLSPLDEHERPYKPTDSDRTSLSMKKKRHLYEEDTNEARNTGTDKLTKMQPKIDKHGSGEFFASIDNDHSRSPSLARSQSLSAFTSQEFIARPLCTEATRSRRWTVTSKSAATQSVTPLRSTVKQSTPRDDKDSPAMITLRRATTSRPAKRTELTFFPEPKFGSQKTGLFSYLISGLTWDDTASLQNSSVAWNTQSGSSKPQRASIGGNPPPMTFPAATVYTETTVETTLAIPGLLTKATDLRRCSTKYISGGSTYEVIWDENDNSSSSRNSTQHSSEGPDRRPSLALVRLEARLSRDHTRRSSDQSSNPLSRTSRNSNETFLGRDLTPEKLKQILPRLLHKASLRDLPRSKGSSRITQPFEHVVGEYFCEESMVMNDAQNINESIEFFLPLRSQKASIIGTKSEETRRASAISITPPSPRQTRFGDMIGSSSHTRRRSSALPEKTKRKAGKLMNLRARFGSNSSIPDFSIGHSETQPLLRKRSDRYTSR